MNSKVPNDELVDWRERLCKPIPCGIFLGVFYYFVAWVGIALQLEEHGVPNFSPSVGLIFGLLVILPPRDWRFVLPWAYPGGILIGLQHGLSLGHSVGGATLQMGEGLFAAWLYTRLASHPLRLNCINNWGFFILSSFLSALIAPLAAWVLPELLPLSSGDQGWFHGSADFLGLILVGSVVISCVTSGREWIQTMDRQRWLEFSFLLGGFLGASFLIFGRTFKLPGMSPLGYLTFPFLIWSALRFGLVGTSMISMVLANIAFFAKAFDLGPFISSSLSTAQEVASVQILLHLGFLFSMTVAVLKAERDAGEIALRSSEKRFQNLVENQMFVEMAQQVAHIGSWHSNPYDLEHLNWSPEVFRIFGIYEPQWDRRIQSFFNQVHPDDLERVKQASHDAISKGTPYSIDHRIVRPDGLVRWVHEEAIIIRDEKGQPKQKVGVVQDITERKRIEEARRESEEKYLSIWQNDVFALCLLDAESLHYLEVNRAYAQLYGYQTEELINGMGFQDVCTDPEGGRSVFLRILSASSLHLSLQYHRRKNGTIFPVEITGGSFDWKGRKLITIVTRDITERQKLEEAQHIFQAERDELLERMELQMERMPVACILLDPQFTITYWNAEAERVFGYHRHEIMGQQPRGTIIPKEETPPIKAALPPLPTDEINTHGLNENLTKDGRKIFCEWYNTPLRKSDGTMMGYMCMAKDVTDRVKAEAEVRQLNAVLEERVATRTAALTAAMKELEAFSYSISHDLRAPLRSVHGFATILMEDFHSQLPGEAREYLRIVHQNALQMGRMIDDLLTFSRLGRQALDKKSVNPRVIVDQVLEDLRGDLKGRQVEFQIGDLPECRADPALLRHVWTNLLSNALKYTRLKNPALISLGSRREDGFITFSIKDNGAGFDMKYADKLFGVFQRLHRAEEYEGTGVGLAIVHRIIDRHDGRIWAEAAPGQGATFYFSFPE